MGLLVTCLTMHLLNFLVHMSRLQFGNSFLPHVYFILSKPRFFQKDNRNVFYILLELEKSNGFIGHMSHYAIGQFLGPHVVIALWQFFLATCLFYFV